MPQSQISASHLIPNPVAAERGDRYDTVTIDVANVLKSWKLSLFSYEWMAPDGRIKDLAELPEKEQPKRATVESKIAAGEALEMPILGIGLMDNIEIGSGRDVFLTLAAHGATTMDVHIPRSNQKDFKSFIVQDAGRKGERGNVIFYILIAIVLFAALSFAMSNGGRSSTSTLQEDRNKLLATDIAEYGETIARAAAQIRLRGATPAQVSFAHDDLDPAYGTPGGNDAEFEIFNTAGGGVIVRAIESGAGVNDVTPTLFFSGANEIADIGTTTANAQSSDLVLFVSGLRAGVCNEINILLNNYTHGTAMPSETTIDNTLFNGTFGYNGTIADGSILAGKNAGCFLNTTTVEYIYYRVLVAR